MPRSGQPSGRLGGLLVVGLMTLASIAAGCGHAATADPDAAITGQPDLDADALQDGAACSVGPDGSIGGPPPASCPNDFPPDDDCPAASPSYQADIAPIIRQRCTVCHTTGGLAPTPQFGSYDEIRVRKTETSMLTFVFSCRMPPSCAPQLTAAERKKMLKWFACNFLNN